MDVRFPADRDFTRRLIKPNTWYIHGHPESACTYLVIGRDKALVIDSGMNRNSIRDYIENITDLPLIVCNTHSHSDHTTSNRQFSDCLIYMSAAAADECKNNSRLINPGECTLNYEPSVIEEKFIINLGCRDIEAIAIGCHSPGSLGYIDHKYKILFSGDELESGQVLIDDKMNSGFGCVERYLNNLLKLKAREAEFDTICPAHNGSPMDAAILDTFIENCDRILSGIEGKKDISSPTYLGPNDTRDPAAVKKLLNNPNFRRSEWKGTAIVYDINKLHLSDEAYGIK